VAHIDGIEKPKFVVRGQDLWVVFGDWIGHRAPDVSDPNDISLVEHFFWGPSTGEIVCKQAHMILQKINSLPNSMSKAKWLMTERGRHHEDWMSDIIYPDRILPKWDAEKSRNTVVREWDTWFYRDKNTEYYQNWKKGMDHLDSTLDKKWKRSNTIYNGGLIPKWSQPRKIGRIKQNIIQE
jgi:hypothetical protein